MSTHRSEEDWKIHDRVIGSAKERLEREGYYVVANPDGEKNPGGSVKRDDRRVYPDLVIRPSKGKSITRLEEVETEDSVDDGQVKQWKEYNAGESSFYLIVPEGYVSRAKALIRNEGFSIDGFFEYRLSGGVDRYLPCLNLLTRPLLQLRFLPLADGLGCLVTVVLKSL